MNHQNCALNLPVNVIIMLMSLIVIISVSSAEANIDLFFAKDNTTITSFLDRVTSFGPYFPENGIMGHHIFADNPDGCTSVLPAPSNGTWFAVMSHSSDCFPADKVLNAQRVGYQSAILYMNHTDELPQDVGYIIDDKIHIPSTVVGKSSVHLLLKYEKRLDVVTYIHEKSTKYFWTLVLFGIGGIAVLLLLGSCLVWLVNHCCNGEKSMGILSRWKLKKLKVHTYRAGDNFEVCAICLEDYKEGDKLRILPCVHAFHCKCVDVWLTENRKTCPLCNKAADSKQRHESHRINEDREDRTPLLFAEALPPVGYADNAASNENSAENLRVHHARGNVSVSIAEVHEAPSAHRGRRNYGSVDLEVRDQPPPSTGICGGLTENAQDSSSLPDDAASFGSFVRPARFYVGTPRDSEESSIPRTGFAQTAGQQESASETEAVDRENRIPTASTSSLSKPYCAETDKV